MYMNNYFDILQIYSLPFHSHCLDLRDLGSVTLPPFVKGHFKMSIENKLLEEMQRGPWFEWKSEFNCSPHGSIPFNFQHTSA